MKTEGKIWILAETKTSKKTKPLSLVQAQMYILKLRKKDFATTLIWTPGWQNWILLQDFLDSDQTFFVMKQPPLSQKDKGLRADTLSEHTQTKTKSKTKLKHEKSGKIELPPEDHKAGDSLYTLVDLNASANSPDYGYFYEHFNGDDLTLSGEEKNAPQIKLASKEHEKRRKPLESMMERRKDVRHDFKIEIQLINQKSSFRSYSENISMHGTRLEDEVPRSFLNSPFDLLIINKLDPNMKTAGLLFKAKIVGDLSDPRRLNFQSADPEMMKRLQALLSAYISYYHIAKKKNAG
jgi:hypothetical protein